MKWAGISFYSNCCGYYAGHIRSSNCNASVWCLYIPLAAQILKLTYQEAAPDMDSTNLSSTVLGLIGLLF